MTLMLFDLSIIESEWSGDRSATPVRFDFDPFDEGFDPATAWEHFGGLSRNEAYERFRKAPDYYQEDFMFMGGRAFAFYYPVIERYVLDSVVSDDEYEVEAVRILAEGIAAQFKSKTAESVHPLRPRVSKLASFVRSHLDHFCRDADRQESINQAWIELERLLGQDIAE